MRRTALIESNREIKIDTMTTKLHIQYLLTFNLLDTAEFKEYVLQSIRFLPWINIHRKIIVRLRAGIGPIILTTTKIHTYRITTK